MAFEETRSVSPVRILPSESPATRRFGIALCLSHFYPTVGGAERQLFQLARQWQAAGHPVVVFTRTLAGQPRVETVDGVVIRRSIRTWNLGPLFGLTYLISLGLSLWRHRRDYEVVLAGQAGWEAVAAALAAKLTGAPLMIRAASAGPRGDLAQLAAAKGGRLWLRLIRTAQRFLASSDEARQQFLAAGCSPQRVLLAHNGVDLASFRVGEPAADALPTAIFVGRLVEVKRLSLLLEAWQRVNARGDFRLLIVGDGPLRESLAADAQRRQLSHVEFVGQQDDVAPWYRRAQVFVLPSAIEGSSNSLLEAMASGLCPVVTRVGGNVDIIHDGRNGLLVGPDDAAGLAAALSQTLGDPQLCRRLGSQARAQVVAEHDLAAVAQRYLQWFSELVAARRP